MAVTPLVSNVEKQLAAVLQMQVHERIYLVVGAEKEVQNLSSNLRQVQLVSNDAESRRFKEAHVQMWLKALEFLSYEMKAMLGEWITEIHKQKTEVEDSAATQNKAWWWSCFLTYCLCFREAVSDHHGIAEKIKGLDQELESIVKEKDQYKFLDETIIGRDADKRELISRLLSEEGDEIQTISVIGSGGLGKTTVAQLAYNSEELSSIFKKKIWVSVSDPFDQIGIAKAILERLGDSFRDYTTLKLLTFDIMKKIKEEKLLLVLDHVWTEDSDNCEQLESCLRSKWEPLESSLRCGAPGSKILLITRSERVAVAMGPQERVHLGLLSDLDCVNLIRRIAFSGRSKAECEKLQVLAEQIAKRCKGSPLAAKTLGSLLRFKKSEQQWQRVLDSKTWELKNAEVVIVPH